MVPDKVPKFQVPSRPPTRPCFRAPKKSKVRSSWKFFFFQNICAVGDILWVYFQVFCF